MRIITGKYKFRNIKLAKALKFKPVIGSIRESMFNVLNHYLNWTTVVVCDLFAGSGILGLEALSWGSKYCYFNDINGDCCQSINKNCQNLGITNVKVSQNSYSQLLAQMKVQKTLLDLVFIDPPYEKINLVYDALNLLYQKKLLKDQAILVVKTNQEIDVSQYKHLFRLKQKKYGKHYLYFLQFLVNKTASKLDLKSSKLVIISGPSGVGKKKIIQGLLAQKDLNLTYSISVTTRLPRVGEKDQIDYYFVSQQEFTKQIEENNFIEYAQYLDHYYGTSKIYVQRLIGFEKNVLFEIEIIGALEIKKQFKTAIWIFISPPSEAELKKRIENRGTETLREIKQRLQKAKEEMAQVIQGNLCDYYLINYEQTATITNIVAILQKEFQN